MLFYDQIDWQNVRSTPPATPADVPPPEQGFQVPAIKKRAPKVLIVNKRTGAVIPGSSAQRQKIAATAVKTKPAKKPAKKPAASKSQSSETKPKAVLDVDTMDWPALLQNGQIEKQTVPVLKAFCRSKGLPVSGKKADLAGRCVLFLSTITAVQPTIQDQAAIAEAAAAKELEVAPAAAAAEAAAEATSAAEEAASSDDDFDIDSDSD
jgi:hypothetical protein